MALATRNRDALGLEHAVTVVEGDLASAVDPELMGTFAVLVSNPPYIPSAVVPTLPQEVIGYEPGLALDGGEDGLDFYRFIASKWKSAIRLGGTLLFEVGIGQAPDVEEILSQNGFEQIQTTADTQGIWRVVEGTINN